MDQTKLAAQMDALHAGGAGVTTVIGEVNLPELSLEEVPYIGYMDSAAIHLKVIKVLEGALPKKDNEIAVESSTLRKLGLKTKIGESVKLPAKTSTGVQKQNYTLVGILSDYLDDWKLLDASALSASGISTPIQVPGIITIENDAPVLTANVLYPLSSDAQKWNLGGHAVDNVNNKYSNPYEENEKKTATILSVVLTAFLALVIILGIYNIVEITLKDREKYVRLMRCIGLTGRQAFRLFMLQGIYLVLAADLLSCLLGTAFLYGGVWISGLMGQPMVLTISDMPYKISLILCTITVLAVFWKQTKVLLKRQPLDYDTMKTSAVKSKHEFSWKLPVLWQDANRKAHRQQNRLTIVLIAGCIFALLFGSFYAEFGAKTAYAGLIDYYEGADYTLNINGGTSEPTTLFTIFPRNQGVSQDNIQKLRNTDGIRVDFATITMTSKQFLLISETEKNPYLLKLKTERAFAMDELSKKIQAQLGYSAKDTLAEATIVGMDSQGLESLSRCIVDGKFDMDKFTSGDEVAVMGTGLHVGDDVRLTNTVFSPETTINKIQGTPVVHTVHAKVGAVLSLEKGNFPNPRMVPIREGIIMSAKCMMDADPSVKYDSVILSNTKPDNEKVTADAKDLVYHVYSQSYNMQFLDMAQRRQEWRDLADQMMSMTYLTVSVFMIIVLFAFAVTTSLKVKTNLHSYTLLRAIGLDRKQMRNLLYYDNLRNAVIGILIGAVLGFISCTVMALTMMQYSSIEIFLTVLLPLLILGSALILAISVAACIRPLKWILKQPVMSALNSVEY